MDESMEANQGGTMERIEFTPEELQSLTAASRKAAEAIDGVFGVLRAISARLNREWEPHDEGEPVRNIVDELSTELPETITQEMVARVFGHPDNWSDVIPDADDLLAPKIPQQEAGL